MKTLEFEKQLAEIHQQCFYWALSRCHFNEQIAEEVLQDSYVKAFNNKEKFDGRSSFKTWVFTIIRNTAIDQFRKKQRHLELEQDAFSDHKEAKSASQERKVRAKSDELAAKHVIAQLSKREQEVVELMIYQELSAEEAAKIMEVSRASVYTYFKRAKKALKDIVIKEKERPSGPSFEQSLTYKILKDQKKTG